MPLSKISESWHLRLSLGRLWERMPKAPAKSKTEAAAPKKAGSALSQPVQPDAALAAIVGSAPLARTEITKKLWDYIKAHKLQDAAKKSLINADAALKPVFDGKAQVTMFEMTKLVGGHIKKI